MPSMGFSPDSRFPVTFAEKDLLQRHLEGSNDSGVRLSGDTLTAEVQRGNVKAAAQELAPIASKH